jgi:hypothetical protein
MEGNTIPLSLAASPSEIHSSQKSLGQVPTKSADRRCSSELSPEVETAKATEEKEGKA